MDRVPTWINHKAMHTLLAGLLYVQVYVSAICKLQSSPPMQLLVSYMIIQYVYIATNIKALVPLRVSSYSVANSRLVSPLAFGLPKVPLCPSCLLVARCLHL